MVASRLNVRWGGRRRTSSFFTVFLGLPHDILCTPSRRGRDDMSRHTPTKKRSAIRRAEARGAEIRSRSLPNATRRAHAMEPGAPVPPAAGRRRRRKKRNVFTAPVGSGLPPIPLRQTEGLPDLEAMTVMEEGSTLTEKSSALTEPSGPSAPDPMRAAPLRAATSGTSAPFPRDGLERQVVERVRARLEADVPHDMLYGFVRGNMPKRASVSSSNASTIVSQWANTAHRCLTEGLRLLLAARIDRSAHLDISAAPHPKMHLFDEIWPFRQLGVDSTGRLGVLDCVGRVCFERLRSEMTEDDALQCYALRMEAVRRISSRRSRKFLPPKRYRRRPARQRRPRRMVRGRCDGGSSSSRARWASTHTITRLYSTCAASLSTTCARRTAGARLII